MKTKEVTVGASNTIDVVLEEDADQLDEIVVTALGIKRQKKELGYAVQDVKGDELNKVISTNVASALSGRVSGVDISLPATGVGGSTRVIIRGISSIGSTNQPLYVVDGIPIDNNGLSNEGEATSKWFGGRDNGDGISSINPDDIESMSVLKGAAAAALYGSRALNGVILVTTKKGKKGKLTVELNSGISIDYVDAVYDDFQREYGAGTDGKLPDPSLSPDQIFGLTTSAWGPKFSQAQGETFPLFDGSERPYELTEDNISAFFRDGITRTNGVSLSGGNENVVTRFSFNNLQNDDVIPNAGLERNTFNLSTTLKTDKFTFDAKANYIIEKGYNRPDLGDSPNNIGYSLSGLAPNINQAWLENYKDQDGNIYRWNSNDYLLNPYFVLNETNNTTTKNRFIGFTNASYEVKDWLSFSLRTGIDTFTFNAKDYMGAGSTWPGRDTGYIRINDIDVTELNTDLIATISNVKVTDDINFSSILGVSRRDSKRESNAVFGTNIIDSGIQFISNFSNQTIEAPSVTKTRTNSIYGSARFDYKGYLYTEFTGRQDYFSVINENVIDPSAFYPSASLGFVFSDAFNIKSDVFSYGKFRASWAKVSNAPGAYKNALNYTVLPSFNGSSIVDIKNSAAPKEDLTFQSKVGFEMGVDLAFFKNRLKADISVYREDISDQALDIPSSATSGFEFIAVNAGLLRNEGIELFLSGTPIKNDDFEWGIDLNFSKNKNKVLELYPGFDTFTISEARWAGAAITAKVGGQYGAIIGRDFKKTPTGEIIHGANGLPLFTDEKVELGNGTPDWTAGLTNRFNYKNFSLQFLFDIKVGMDVYSMTNSVAATRGLLDVTTQGRDAYNSARALAELDPNFDPSTWVPTDGYVSPGVVNTGTEDAPVYQENTQAVNPQNYWQTVFQNTPSPFIYDASYVKLREITLGYSFPKKWLGAIKVSSLNMSFFARNLFVISDVPNVDPESMYTAGNGQGFEYGSLPFRRSYGFNVKVKF
jgi:TonB-linked SusC/RagA family outer membrane protein